MPAKINIILYSFFNLFIALSTGCSTFKTAIPYAHVESPEVPKPNAVKWKFIDISGAKSYIISNDASVRPPVINETNELSINDNKTMASALLDYSPLENFSTGLTYGDESGFKFKYQFLNFQNQNTPSKFVASVFTHLSIIYSTNSGDQNGTFGPGGYKWDAQSKTENLNLGVSLGYRKDAKSLVFIGVAHNQLSMNSKIHQDSSFDGSSAGGEYLIDKTGASNTLSLGYIDGDINSFEISANYSDLTYGTSRSYDSYVNLGILMNFENLFKTPSNYYEIYSKESWTTRDFVAVPLGFYIGFGSGQAVQDNWKTKGQYFAMADSSSIVMMLLSSSSKSLGGSSGSLDAAALMLGVSRIWQLIDTIMDASSSEGRSLKKPQPLVNNFF